MCYPKGSPGEEEEEEGGEEKQEEEDDDDEAAQLPGTGQTGQR